MATYTGKWGTRVTGRVERAGSGYLRRDTWTPHKYLAGEPERPYSEPCHLDAHDDDSDAQVTYPDGGDGLRCGWCYLGANHSQRAHAARVAAYRAEKG